MEDVNPHRRFFQILVATFLVVFLLGSVFNYFVDPYRLFGTPTIAGLNELKPAASERVRVIKPYMATRVGPKAVIGGNSRPEIGLNPRSACWGKMDQPVFNMGIPGASVFMQTRYLQQAVESGRSQRALLGVDFLDFLVDASKLTAKIDWRVLGRNFDGRLDRASESGLITPFRIQEAEDVLSGLFSLVALGDSVTTIASQRDRYSATRREDGFNPGLDYSPIIHNEGQSVLFTQKNQVTFETSSI